MGTVITIWNFLTVAAIITYGVAMLVRAEKAGKELESAVLLRGCVTLLAIGIAGMLIITILAFIV